MELNLEKYHLKSTSFFDFLEPKLAIEVKSKVQRREFTKGEFLFKEKSYSKGVYIIRKGKVKIFQSTAEGKQSIVYIYKKGDYFGYRPLLANEPHPVSAVAMDGVVATFIPGELFNYLLSSSSLLARNLLIVLTKEFSVWVNKMTIFSQYGVKARVALSLLILDKVYQREEGTTQGSSIAINRDDFSSFVGTAKETLVRMLRIFKNEGIITSKGTKIRLLKPKAIVDLIFDR